MEAYGYKVTGSAAVLKDIAEVVKSENMWVNWGKFKTGDIYRTGNGDGYTVNIDHELKTVELTER